MTEPPPATESEAAAPVASTTTTATTPIQPASSIAPGIIAKTTVEDVEDQDETHPPNSPAANGETPDNPGPILEAVPKPASAPAETVATTSTTAAVVSEPEISQTGPEATSASPAAKEETPKPEKNGIENSSSGATERQEDQSTRPFVRPYDSTRDYEELLDICIKTASPSLYSLPPKLLPLIPSIWCKPYLLFSPSTCFVLHDPTLDKPVGYIIGTPSTLEFVKTYKDNYLPLVDVQWPAPDSEEVKDLIKAGELKEDLVWIIKTLYDPDSMIPELVIPPEELPSDKPAASTLDIYPAHLHIDILPSHQRQGHGPLLLATFEEKLKSLGVEGVHLGMDPNNHGAARWYERVGFKERERVRNQGGKYFVKRL